MALRARATWTDSTCFVFLNVVTATTSPSKKYVMRWATVPRRRSNRSSNKPEPSDRLCGIRSALPRSSNSAIMRCTTFVSCGVNVTTHSATSGKRTTRHRRLTHPLYESSYSRSSRRTLCPTWCDDRFHGCPGGVVDAPQATGLVRAVLARQPVGEAAVMAYA